MRSLITVNIEADGKWPTDKELENRNAVISDLSNRNMGKFVNAGSAIGSMHFTYEVHDARAAKAMISKSMFNHLPSWKHSIETVPVKMTNQVAAANDVGKRPRRVQNDRQQGFGIGR